jgi:hypothetical protein
MWLPKGVLIIPGSASPSRVFPIKNENSAGHGEPSGVSRRVKTPEKVISQKERWARLLAE